MMAVLDRLVNPCGRSRRHRAQGMNRWEACVPWRSWWPRTAAASSRRCFSPRTSAPRRRRRAAALRRVPMTSRETSDLVMLAMGAYTPLAGFMGYADWRGSCVDMRLGDGTFWPIPHHLVVRPGRGRERSRRARRSRWSITSRTASWPSWRSPRNTRSIGPWSVPRSSAPPMPSHPGVAKVMAQGEVNLAGPGAGAERGRLSGGIPRPLHAPGRNPRRVRGARMVEGRRLPDAQPDAPQPRASGQDRRRALRRRAHPPGPGPAQGGRHPGRGPNAGDRRFGRALLRSRNRHPGRLSHRDALRRAARGPAARGIPPEFRLLASGDRPRPCRRRRLLRPLRTPIASSTRSTRTAWRSSP